jgi:tetratricopeptide (TPR) repeat protein
MPRVAPFAFAFLLAACQGLAPGVEPPTVYDIGVVHRAVTTKSADAQLWFDRGLALTYGFNREEAIRCFEQAAQIDPDCAMAYWGKAYALGPNYNNGEMTPDAFRDAFAASEMANARAASCTQVEQDLIGALRSRYPSADPADRGPLDAAFADAMREVHREHKDDADVAALTA